MTRKDYMDGKVTHREYYASICKSAGLAFGDESRIVKRCRNSKDPHYNDIPLSEWDMMAMFSKRSLSSAFKMHDDFYSDAGGVCACKEAVRQAVERVRASGADTENVA